MCKISGDSGYPQQPWQFVPIQETENEAENDYNRAHRKARLLVERCIGVLKSRFRCLSRQRMLMYTPATAGSIITACAVLHNIMVAERYPLPLEADIINEMDDHDEEDLLPINYNPANIVNEGNAARNRLIREFFG